MQIFHAIFNWKLKNQCFQHASLKNYWNSLMMVSSWSLNRTSSSVTLIRMCSIKERQMITTGRKKFSPNVFHSIPQRTLNRTLRDEVSLRDSNWIHAGLELPGLLNLSKSMRDLKKNLSNLLELTELEELLLVISPN